MRNARLTAVGEETIEFVGEAPAQAPRPAAPQSNVAQAALMNLLLMSLRALSQRAVVALGNLYGIMLAGSAFWLWYTVLPAPDTRQLIGCGLYGLLIIALHIVRGRNAVSQ